MTPSTVLTRAHERAFAATGRRAVALAAGATVWLLAGLARAQILTLEEIEERAQRERAELTLQQAAIARAQAQAALVASESGPTLGMRAEAGLAPGGELVEVADENGDLYLVQGSRTLGEADAFAPRLRFGATLAGRATLLDFGRTRAGVRAAEAAVGAERAALVQAKVELVQRARSAYLDWVEAHQTWQLAERDADVAAARTVSVRELITEGARPATDATLSAYDEQLARLRQNRAFRAAEAALEALGAVVQSELPERAVPDLDVLEPVPPAGVAQPESGADGERPASGTLVRPQARPQEDSTVRALNLQRDAALSAALAADRAAAPSLDAAVDVGVQGQDSAVFPVYRATLSLTVPLWDGGARSAQAAIHRAEADGLDAQRKVREQTLAREDLAARRRWDAATTELRASLELLEVAERMLSEAEDHYRSGSDTLERVLSAQRSLVQARREVLSARLETARARLDLTPVKLQ